METEVLSAYSDWDLSLPISPLRSYLYSLQPIGVGTSEVESLTGYVARLAAAHCVSPGDLIAHEFKSLVKQPRGKSYLHQVSASTEILNGTGQMASEFAQVLERLTLRQDLHHLTLRQWANVLPSKGLLRRSRAWCPACYEEWQKNERNSLRATFVGTKRNFILSESLLQITISMSVLSASTTRISMALPTRLLL